MQPLYHITNAQAEAQILDGFVVWVRDHETPVGDGRVEVVNFPDKPEGGHGAGGCDAILSRFGVQNAVEITQIEPLKNLQACTARLTPLKLSIELLMREKFPGHFASVSVREDQLLKRFDPEALAEQIFQKLTKLAVGTSATIEVAGVVEAYR